MEHSKLDKSLGFASNCILFFSIVLTYILKEFNLLKVNNFSEKNFMYIILGSVLLLVLKLAIDIKKQKNNFLKTISQLIEILIIFALISTGGVMRWTYFLLTIPIITSTFTLNRKYSFIILIFYGLAILSAPTGIKYPAIESNLQIELWTVYLVLLFIWILLLFLDSERRNDNKLIEESKRVNEELLSQNEEINHVLEDVKGFNSDLETANLRLEDTNQKLNKQVAEFYTLQQVSQAIATILDIKELLNLVNDVIIGVMGVNYSTILILNDENRLEIKTTNMSSDLSLQTLRENIDCELLNSVATTGKPLMDNNADEVKYPFLRNRDTKSIICVPLSSKNENYGIVLIEQNRSQAFTNDNLKIISIIGNQTSVALENVSLYEKMQILATTDGLTKIYNRLYFNDRISKEMARADQGKYSMAVSIFDIDHFKKFNDTYGHLFGDKVLKTIARLAKDSIRPQDIIARYGGEEFVILMPNTNLDTAYEIIEKIRIKISEFHVKEDSISASVTASFGISCYPQHGSAEAEVLSAADTALYRAKMDGRNCTRIFEQSMMEK